jgi:hypothetical protein
MIAGLLQKVEEILTGNKFEKEKEKRRSFQRAIQGDNVGVRGNGLMNRCLCELGNEFFFIKVGLG